MKNLQAIFLGSLLFVSSAQAEEFDYTKEINIWNLSAKLTEDQFKDELYTAIAKFGERCSWAEYFLDNGNERDVILCSYDGVMRYHHFSFVKKGNAYNLESYEYEDEKM